MPKQIKCYLFCAKLGTGEFVTLTMSFLNSTAVTDRMYVQGQLTTGYLTPICHEWDDFISHSRGDRNLDWIDCPTSKKKNPHG